MNRRNVLKQLGLVATAGVVLPSLPGLLTGCRPEDPVPEIQYDGVVAVIGAGAAGLYVSDILKSKGINVKIFEASDRPGGRIRSLKLTDDSLVRTDFPIELGAERILGTDSLWSAIVSQLNVPVIDLNSISDNYIIDNAFKSELSLQADGEFLAAKNFYENLYANQSGSLSVLQSIQSSGINERVYAILNSWIGNKYGTSNDRLGMKALVEGLNGLSRNYDERILRSNAMQDVLVSRFSAVIPSVEFNAVIKTVDSSSAKIKLTGEKVIKGSATEAISFEADKVIIAVPVSMLKNGFISFIPSLPASKITSLSKIRMDACVRAVLDFKQNFWASDSRFIYGGTVAPEYFNSGVLRSEFNKTLSVTVNGAQAEKFSGLGKDQVIQAILQELDTVFNGKATINIRRDDGGNVINEYFDWTKEPYIQGGISYVSANGSIEDRTALAQPVNESIFFAGEATDSSGEAGTINGALLSAERAAQEVVASILNS